MSPNESIPPNGLFIHQPRRSGNSWGVRLHRCEGPLYAGGPAEAGWRVWPRAGAFLFCFFHSILWARNNSRSSSQVLGRQGFAFFHAAPAGPSQQPAPVRPTAPKSKPRKAFYFSNPFHRCSDVSPCRITTSVFSKPILRLPLFPLLLRCLRSLLFLFPSPVPFCFNSQMKKGPPPGSHFPRGGPFLILRPPKPKLCRYPASRDQLKLSRSAAELQPQDLDRAKNSRIARQRVIGGPPFGATLSGMAGSRALAGPRRGPLVRNSTRAGRPPMAPKTCPVHPARMFLSTVLSLARRSRQPKS